MLIAALLQAHRRGVLFVQALLDHKQVPGLEVVQAGRHRSGPPVVGRDALGIGGRLVHRGRIVDADQHGAGARARPYRRGFAVARMIVLELRLFVLVGLELEAIPPAILIPVRLDQRAALHAVAHGVLRLVARVEEAVLGALDPHPGGEEDRGDHGLSEAWRDIDDQVLDAGPRSSPAGAHRSHPRGYRQRTASPAPEHARPV